MENLDRVRCLYDKAIEILYFSKKTLDDYLKGEISEGSLKNKTKILKVKLNELKKMYKTVEEEINQGKLNFENLNGYLNKLEIPNSEIYPFSLKPIESLIGKIARKIVENDSGISDIIRGRILVNDEFYEEAKEKIKDLIIQEDFERESSLTSFQFENPIYANWEGKDLEISGKVLEEVENRNKVYFYELKFKDESSAKKFYQYLKENFKITGKKNKNLYNLFKDKCSIEIFKGQTAYIGKEKNKIYIFLFEEPLINSIERKELGNFMKYAKGEIKRSPLGLYKISDLAFIERHPSALVKVDSKYLFNNLGIKVVNYLNAIIDEKEIKELGELIKNLPNRQYKFFNVIISLDEIKREDNCLIYKPYPMVELQVMPQTVNRYEKGESPFSHFNYEKRRREKFYTRLKLLSDNYEKNHNTILNFLNPLINNSDLKNK